jgi:ribose-phosphate pyrophosphokinase
VTHIVGEVRGRACLLIDDMISTGGTIAESMEAIRDAGADREIFVAATHGLLLDGARDRLKSATRVIVTDSVNVPTNGWDNLDVLSVAPLFAEAIRRISADGSLGWLR